MHRPDFHVALRTAVLALLALGTAVFCWLQGRPHFYPDAPAGQFACLSYTPRSARSTSIADVQAQIEQDMQQLAKRTRCVRTYSVLNGLDYVVVVARKLHMRVLLGIWISRDALANEREINHAIVTADAYREVIDAIVVGNEVLLRREQNVDALSAMLVRVHAATQLPVTYADVWDFWLKNPQLAEASDFITIHILPYWDDLPTGVDHAMAQVERIFRQTQQTFPGRRIYVGETGWPSAGRQREEATPDLLNQARFTREFIALASAQHIPYNFIEAYDQPWKRGLEGTVGGYWGLYDAQGHDKFPLVGAVVADPSWWRGLLAGIPIALLLLICNRLRFFNKATLLPLLLAGFSVGAIGVMQWDYLWQSLRDWQECVAMGCWTAISYCVVLLNLGGYEARTSRLTAAARFALLFGVAYINLGLVFDARYRDFPTSFLFLPTILLLLNKVTALQRERVAISAETMLLCSWLILSAVIIAIKEGALNHSALLWCVVCALLGAGLLFDTTGLARRNAHPQQHAQQ